MQEIIKTIEGLIQAGKEIKQRTPHLEVAIGALHTALENIKAHAATPPSSDSGATSPPVTALPPLPTARLRSPKDN